MTKQLFKIAAAVMTTVLALIVLWQFRIVLVYVLLSLMLAAALRPLFTRLAGRSRAARVAWILLYVVALGSFVFLLFSTVGSAISDIQQLAQSVLAQDGWRLPAWLQASSFGPALLAQLPAPSTLFDAVTGDQGQLVLPALVAFTQGIGGIAGAAFIILFLSINWSTNQFHFERLWLSLLASEKRKQARDIWRTVEFEIGAYLRGEVIQGLLTGVLLGLGYWLLGSPYSALLALAGALLFLVPVVGAALALVPMVLVGLLTSVELSFWTTIYTLIVLIALEVFLKPRLSSRKWNNLVLTVVLLLALGDAFGLVGIIIAPPLSLVMQIVWAQLVSQRTSSVAKVNILDLRERKTRLERTIEEMDRAAVPLVTSSMQRLADLIAKTEPILQALPVESPQPAPNSIPDPGGNGSL